MRTLTLMSLSDYLIPSKLRDSLAEQVSGTLLMGTLHMGGLPCDHRPALDRRKRRYLRRVVLF